MARRALVIANEHYQEGFTGLPGATADASALYEVLSAPEIGGYEVEILRDATALDCRIAIQRFFAAAGPHDLLLLHLSCHGRKDRRNRLHFVASDTRADVLEATSVSAEFVTDQMESARSRRIVTLLDCCYSGAVTKGLRTRGELQLVDIEADFQGQAQYIITSSTALQYSHEGDWVSRREAEPSVFTAAVVEGLRTGAADLDGDGRVSADDLFAFVQQRVRETVAGQTPTRLVTASGAALVVARNPAMAPGIALVHVPQDRLWAEWIAEVLTGAGLRVVMADVTALGLPDVQEAQLPVLLLSAGFRGFEQGRLLPPTRWPATQAVPILLDGAGSVADPGPGRGADDVPDDPHTGVALAGLSEDQAVAALLGAFGGRSAGPGTPPPASGLRFPGSAPASVHLPPRNTQFTGREDVLEALRKSLGRRPVVLLGLGGIGKTQLALEYAHRYASQYDLVWWISAEQTELALAGLVEIAAELGLPPGDDLLRTARDAWAVLSRRAPSLRWLLIFDNATGLEAAEHFPIGDGHIIVTSRRAVWAEEAAVIPVDVFRRAESVSLLRRRAPQLSASEAGAVADAVGDLPAAVSTAASWLETAAVPVEGYLDQLRETGLQTLATPSPADRPFPLGVTWNVSIERMRAADPAAVRLLELCAFLGPEPIAAELLYTDGVLALLAPYDPDLRSTFGLSRLSRGLARYGLVALDEGGRHLQVHRLVVDAVRREMDAGTAQRTADAARRLLLDARAQHGPVTDPATWPLVSPIWPHLGASGMHDCGDPQGYDLVLDRVRYLLLTGTPPHGRLMIERLAPTWLAQATEDVGLRRHHTRLRCLLGAALRQEGRYADALAVDAEAREEQRARFGEDDSDTLAAALALGGDLRGLGRYRDALELDREIHVRCRDLLGTDHPLTSDAALALAVDHRLTGRPDTAIAMAAHLYAQAVRTPGRPLAALAARSALALALIPAGGPGAEGEASGSDAVGHALAVADEAARTFGRTHAHTLTAQLNLARAHAAAGHPERAVRVGADTRAAFAERLGALHPLTLVSQANHATDLQVAPDPEDSAEPSGQAMSGLEQVLGPEHPIVTTLRNGRTVTLDLDLTLPF
ncbi:FxSxx-COOH system tetratricopeptide repeat protein [Kitasatospora sp. NPDC057015]|uniref:FxSxx-COOH system tetratricopeptide repeat protein n=1 Tax=Kitasatospora sp. NPDC057015 TaxID=3346001 RepID=UPI00362B3B28